MLEPNHALKHTPVKNLTQNIVSQMREVHMQKNWCDQPPNLASRNFVGVFIEVPENRYISSQEPLRV